MEDPDEDEDDELDEIIQSVFTDGQKATYKICKESISKKGRVSRGDVRGLFVPGATLFRKPGISNNSAENVCDVANVPPPDYDDQDNDDVDGGPETKHEKNIIRHPNKVMSNRNSRRFQMSSPDLLNVFEALFDCSNMQTACCKIHHIGRNDSKRINVFAETEIRTIFRQNGDLKINKMQTKRKEKDLGVFGVSLETLLTRDCKKNPHLKVPLFLQSLVTKLENHLEEEGILRVPGSLARIREVGQQLETSENYSIILQPLLPHDLVGLLKRFFRDLPTPILTLNWLDAFCKVADNIKDEKLKLHAIQTLMCVLPDVNRATLQVLFGLLVKIVQNPQNKMTEQNITMIITPSLFLVDSLPSASTPINGFDSLAFFSPIVMYFLKHYNLIWDVRASIYIFESLCARVRLFLIVCERKIDRKLFAVYV
ncbi:hypothetical protein HELRODRAFT_106328 [Helobdella robusta]|uniref:Rho-GAP domain-containing protein n=1 Tax=Helobdella robusta TaxID=6412 RepID=T1EE20_HELRO|nr:hypothetical protein HELRODRAFT_106328 [Helobdella robusta]ESO01811.1 hypothetical protein HELRODRAFT_106328 [Helobdella robusta]